MSPSADPPPPPGGSRSRPLRPLHAILLRPHRSSLRHPARWLVGTAAVLLLLGSQLPRMRLLLSLESLDEPTLRAMQLNRRERETFRSGHEVAVIFAPSTPGGSLSPRQIRAIGAWAKDEEARNPEIQRVISPFEIRRRRVVFLLPTLNPLIEAGTPEEMRGLAASPWGGILTDREGRDIGIQLEFRDTPGGSRYGRFDPRVLGDLRRRLAERFPPSDGIRVHLAGPAAFEYYSLDGIRRFRILNGVMLALILLLLRTLLGSWKSGVLMAGVLLVAAVCTAGAMASAGHPIDLLSTGLFLILAVAALEDFLFLSYLQLQHGTRWRRAFRSMLVPSFLTSVTTVIGFWSLCLSDIAMIRRLGLWAGVGALIEWVVTFTVIPAFLSCMPSWRTWTNRDRAWQPGASRWLAGRSLPRPLAVGLLLAYLPGLYGAMHLNRNDSLPQLFESRHPYHQGFEYLEASRGYEGSVSVVLPHADDRIGNEAVLRRIAAGPGVVEVLDPYAVLDDVLGVEGVAPSRLEQHRPALAKRLRGFFSPDGWARAVVYIRSVDVESLATTLRPIRSICGAEGGYVAGELTTYVEFSDRVPSTLFLSLGSCMLLVGIVLLLVLHSAGQRGKPLILAASFWGAAVMMGLLWILRVPLNFLTCSFASVLVGLTGDNVIQYVFAAPRGGMPAGIVDRGGASIQVALLMALAALVFVGSAFVPSRRLGILLAVGLMVAVAGDLWVLKALLGKRAGTE